jgi:mRNA-degrading endonuclease RelE of RelBE toxin-antitoxin system
VKWRIEWTEPALDDLAKLDRQVARQVDEALDALADSGQGDLICLRPPLGGYRLLSGTGGCSSTVKETPSR